MGKSKRIWRGMMIMMTIQHDSHPPIFIMHACMYHHHVCVMDVMFMHKACQEDEGETKETTWKYTKARKCGCGASELYTEVCRMRMYTCSMQSNIFFTRKNVMKMEISAYLTFTLSHSWRVSLSQFIWKINRFPSSDTTIPTSTCFCIMFSGMHL